MVKVASPRLDSPKQPVPSLNQATDLEDTDADQEGEFHSSHAEKKRSRSAAAAKKKTGVRKSKTLGLSTEGSEPQDKRKSMGRGKIRSSKGSDVSEDTADLTSSKQSKNRKRGGGKKDKITVISAVMLTEQEHETEAETETDQSSQLQETDSGRDSVLQEEREEEEEVEVEFHLPVCDWIAFLDEGTGNYYYHSQKENTTIWECPEEYREWDAAVKLFQSFENSDGPIDTSEWLTLTEESTHEVYYLNNVHQTTQWAVPAVIRVAKWLEERKTFKNEERQLRRVEARRLKKGGTTPSSSPKSGKADEQISEPATVQDDNKPSATEEKPEEVKPAETVVERAVTPREAVSPREEKPAETAVEKAVSPREQKPAETALEKVVSPR